MLDHCMYDKVKLLHELSSLLWFIQKHAKDDAKQSDNGQCQEAFEKLAQDLEKHIHELEKTICK